MAGMKVLTPTSHRVPAAGGGVKEELDRDQRSM